MKTNIEERSKELLLNLKRLDETAQNLVQYSKKLGKELRLPIFLEMAKDSNGTLSGPYWRIAHKYIKKDQYRVPQKKRGSTHLCESITRAQLFQIRRINSERVPDVMELNVQAKCLRGMRKRVTDEKSKVGRQLQSANEHYAYMYTNYNLGNYEETLRQITYYKRRVKPKPNKG